MKLRILGAAGVSAAALAAVSAAAPAVAAPECGPVPAGATLTVLGGTTCQLEFAAAGSYSWTTPTGVTGLQALLLGGGSGAYWDEVGGIGYAGNSGKLVYTDYTAAEGGVPASIVVGDGGVTSTFGAATPRQDSTVTIASVTAVGDGPAPGGGSVCVPEGASSVDTGNGSGSGGFSSGGVCEAGYAPGLTPSVDAVDSDGNARPAAFSDITTTYGLGGRVLITADTLPADTDLDGLGIGANVRYDSTANAGNGNVTEANATGGSGRVVLRYTIGAAAPTLPAAGLDSAPVLGIAALTAGLGAVLLAISRRRKQV